jgi:hypothetical protein
MKTTNRTYLSRVLGLITLSAVLCSISLTLRAEDAKTDAKKEEPKKKKWESVATVGATLTRGNSKTFLGTGAIATKRTWTADEVLLGASAGYGENTVNGTNNLTDSYVKGAAQWNHLFTPQFYGGVRATGEHDDIAHLTYRATVGPLAGYYFIKQTNTFLAGEVGPSYVCEKFYSEDVHNYIALRLAERGEYKFHSGARIWESLEWLPKVQDFNNYLVNAEAGVAAPINKALSVNLILQDTYKSVPAAGKLKNDLKLIAGLSFNF